MIIQERLLYLLRRVQGGEAEEAEILELVHLIRSDEAGTILDEVHAFHELQVFLPEQMPSFNTPYWQEPIKAILQADKAGTTRNITISGARKPSIIKGVLLSLHKKWWAAAAVVVLVVIGFLLKFSTNKNDPGISKVELVQDILPGKNGAILTLSDGRKLVLDSMGEGVIALQAGANVTLQNGQVLYNKFKNTPNQQVPSFNTLQTPAGRQYQMVLPDGTRVWLNAASSITYPTVFTGNERKVEITGEVYFEVTKNKLSPFQVKANNADVTVLGTHFNINSYSDDESLRTTLLEGSVRVVVNNNNAVVLRPGQQSEINKQNNTVKEVDVDEVMAWKNGLFQFNKTPLSTVLRQISRWYDVEIVYEKNVPDIKLGGEIKRDLSLSQVIAGLGKIGVNFRIEGRKLIVL